MNRRDFGKLAIAGLGAAAVTTTARTAAAAPAKAKGKSYKCRSVKGSDDKNYLLPTGTFDVKPGSQIQFNYTGKGSDGKIRFEVLDAGTAAGAVFFSLEVNGTPSTAMDGAAPASVIFVDTDGDQPITVQQPGG